MVGPVGRQRAHLLQLARQPVALLLKAPEVQQARAGAVGGRARGRGDEGEPIGDDLGDLVLQARDLRPQRDPRGALGALSRPRRHVLRAPIRAAPVGAAVKDLLILLGHTASWPERTRRFYQ